MRSEFYKRLGSLEARVNPETLEVAQLVKSIYGRPVSRLTDDELAELVAACDAYLETSCDLN